MPRTGTRRVNRWGSTAGAPDSYTEAGPPDRITPAGRRASSSPTGVSNGTISEYTWHSRTRRAMSCAYCAPKSTTRTGRGSAMGALLRPHPLSRLKRLAFGLDGRGDDDLRLLEFPDRGVPRGGHRGPKGPEQVQGPVVLVGGADQDLLQAPDPLGRDPSPTGKVGVERGHAPVEPPAWGLVRPGQWGTDHHGIGAARDGLGDVSSRAHTAVGDHMDVPAGLPEVFHPGSGGVGDGRGLGYAHAQYASGGTRRARAHAHQPPDCPRPHQVQGRLVGRTAPDDDRDVERRDEPLQVEGLTPGRDMLGRHHGSLDHQDVELCL